MSLRIALYHNLPSGGAKRTIYETVRRMAEKHTIDIYSLSSADLEFADLRPHVANYHIYPFRPLPLFRSPFGRLNQISRTLDLVRLRKLNRVIAGAIQQQNYDVLFAHPCQYEICPSVVYYLNNLPSVYYCQEPVRVIYEEMPPRPYKEVKKGAKQRLDQLDPLPGIYQENLRRNDWRNIHRAGAVLVNSRFSGESVRRIYGLEPHVSYLGVDTDFFHPIEVEKQHMVLSVGSLTPLKAFDFLIRVMKNIPLEQRPLLVIASNFQFPPERAYLEELAGSLDVRVEFLGNVTDDTLLHLYNRAAITLYAPIREPFGLVPLESMACGTPVVAVREGGMQETIIDGETGFLLDRDEAMFASSVQHLLSDPDLAARLGANGQEHVTKHWSWDHAVDQLENELMVISKSFKH